MDDLELMKTRFPRYVLMNLVHDESGNLKKILAVSK